MKYTKGNLALRDHIKNEKRIFLFENIGKGFVLFITEVIFHDSEGFPTHDTNGNTRKGIKFFLKRPGAEIPEIPNTYNDLNEPNSFYKNVIPEVTERIGLITSRVGQDAFRKRIIHRWEYQCAVTGFDKLDVLIASHIVPWSKSTDEERVDVHNGILLSPTYDALFDKHLISFENSGKIILSDQIEMQAYQRIGVTGKERISKLSSYNTEYLDRHRTQFDEAN